MAVMYPRTFPHNLTKRPKLRGEALVYAALQETCDDDWSVFYDYPIIGSRRRIDFVVVNRNRGVLAIEVKGGMVHDKRGTFRQLLSKAGRRKRVDPFGQLRFGLDDLFRAAGIPQGSLPVHQSIWFPEMGQAGLRWQPSLHILTRETLDPRWLREMIEQALPLSDGSVFSRQVEGVMSLLLEGRTASAVNAAA